MDVLMLILTIRNLVMSGHNTLDGTRRGQPGRIATLNGYIQIPPSSITDAMPHVRLVV